MSHWITWSSNGWFTQIWSKWLLWHESLNHSICSNGWSLKYEASDSSEWVLNHWLTWFVQTGWFTQIWSKWLFWLSHWLTWFVQTADSFRNKAGDRIASLTHSVHSIADSFRSVFNRKYFNCETEQQYIQIKTDARDLTNQPEAVWWCRLPSRWPGPLYWPGSGSPGWTLFPSIWVWKPGPFRHRSTFCPANRLGLPEEQPSTAHKMTGARSVHWISNRSESVWLVLKV